MYDKFGFCVKCHKDLMVERIVDMKTVKMFSPEKDETQFLLDDESKMRVTICRSCKALLTEEDHKDVMNSVIEGWREEVKILDWTEEKKEKHMNIYSKRKIEGVI